MEQPDDPFYPLLVYYLAFLRRKHVYIPSFRAKHIGALIDLL
jgi:hypothetical protein